MVQSTMLRAHIWLGLTTTLLLTSACPASLTRRDTHDLVIPLNYEPISKLLTAAISIGTPGSTYNVLVDTGSPFLALQNASFHATSSTVNPADPQPDLGDAQGYMTTTPLPSSGSKGVEKQTMQFVTDTAYLVEGADRAGGGAKGGNVTIGLTRLDGLIGAQGILGLSPPFDKVGSAHKGGGGEGGGGTKLPSLDVSFLHTYLSSEHRKTLGITGDEHFYLNIVPGTTTSPAPSGELVFPLTGTTLPRSAGGIDYDAMITIDPSSGSTFPAHPFWGIAHAPHPLRFVLDGTALADVRIDAVLLDSGTSGIVAPPSEVEKVFKAAAERIQRVDDKQVPAAVLGKAKCGEKISMAFELAQGKQAAFTAVRPNVKVGWRQDMHVFTADREEAARVKAWKSYIGLGTAGLLQDVGVVTGLRRRKRHLRTQDDVQRHKRGARNKAKRNPQVEVGLDTNILNLASAPSADAAEPAEPAEEECDVSLMGSPEVDKMFPSNGPEFKVWILGLEFFEQNLVYHNIDSATTLIVPRTSA